MTAPLKLAFFITMLSGCSNTDDVPPQNPDQDEILFTCEENIDKKILTEEEKMLEDLLWNETLKYLEGFVEALEKTSGACDASSKAITETFDPITQESKRECLTEKSDVQTMIAHINKVLTYPDKARVCFDSQRNYDVFPLYAPSSQMKTDNPLIKWIDHPTLSDYYKDTPGEIGQAGRELANGFQTILSKSQTPSIISQDITFKGLPNLWGAVGWIPFYAENELALNNRFRGGYAYAEVMGPWGLLRIKSINDQLVGSEIGMTIQLGDTYYPYHYHDPQELYINLTPETCTDENQFMVMDWDNEEFKHKINEDGSVDVEVSAENENWKKWFTPHSSANDWITYFHRHAIHSFYVNKDCFDPNNPSGIVTMWARTTSRTFNQTTRICEPTIAENRHVGPSDLFTCKIDAIIQE